MTARHGHRPRPRSFRTGSPLLAYALAFRFTSLVALLVLTAGVLTLGYVAGAEHALGWLLLVEVLTLAVLCLVRSTVTVTADGLTLSWLGRRRWLAFARVSGVETATLEPIQEEMGARNVDRSIPCVWIQLVGGRRIPLVFNGLDGAVGLRDAFVDAVAGARRAGTNADDAARTAVTASLLARGSDTIDAWAARLEALAGSRGSYRDVALSEEALWQVFENPTVAPRVRSAAAVILRKTLDVVGRERFRLAAETSGAPGLRGALEALGAPDPPDGDAASGLASRALAAASRDDDGTTS